MATTNTTNTYKQYVTLSEKALRKSRKSLDTRSLVRLAYGDDTAHIGGSDMLEGILNGVLDKISNETVLEELDRYGTTSRIVVDEGEQSQQQPQSTNSTSNDEQINRSRMMTPKERLDRIDSVISDVVEWEGRRDRREELDAESARESLDRNLLPEGVSMDQVIAHREFEEKLRAKKLLEGELQRIQEEISTLEEKRVMEQTQIREQLEKVESAEQKLEATANLCAMVTT
ncbi:unnamed protein product [Pseudo-nitzschia multistriata]|uniref:Uncharacterized protein n=1 Tax=Pseudo-nitzschia multistriata TaxID=183589 RepID=A0A448Z825_9STRA|nr:unnamed protein product [Pseudo-nitzschia multistriata]